MLGRLILVSGISGAGKTTLIRYALENSANLIYLITFTTRPQRLGEEDSLEYRFITADKYEEVRLYSKKWDHTEYKGFNYGANVELIRQRLAQGTNIICSIAPDIDTINSMKHLYGIEPVLLWIDTPALVAQQRTTGDSIRSSRDDDNSVKQYFKYFFTPKGELDKDYTNFLVMLEELLK